MYYTYRPKNRYVLGFPMGWDSATFRDKGTSSKSCNGTAYQNPGRDAGKDNYYFSVKIRDGMRDGTITIFSYDFLF